MAQFHPAWLEHQRKRWRRHDWQRYVRPNADGSDAHRYFRPQAAHVGQELIVRKDSGVEREPDATGEEVEAYRSKLLELKTLAVALQWELALWRFSRKYRPDQLRDDHGRFADEGRRDESQVAVAGMPRIPGQRPPTGPERTGIAKEVALWLAQTGVAVFDVVAKNSWLYDAIPNIISYLDAPRRLEELQESVRTPAAGYDVHHIVERSSALEDGYGVRRVDSSENLVRIPRMKHWEINAWYQTRNLEFGGISPREYLRFKDWDDRERVGLRAMTHFGVLKP